MTWNELSSAISDAERTMELADSKANQMARILKGRLRRVSACNLAALKRELRDYNIHTGTWKEDK